MLATDIVLMVKQASGQFLSKESGIWMEVDDYIAREKVSTLLCSRRKQVGMADSASIVTLTPSSISHAREPFPGEADSKNFKFLSLNG